MDGGDPTRAGEQADGGTDLFSLFFRDGDDNRCGHFQGSGGGVRLKVACRGNGDVCGEVDRGFHGFV